MTPLLFAAALSLSPAVAGQTATDSFSPLPPAVQQRLGAERACAKLGVQAVAPDGVPFRKLNELPPGVLEHAVWRRVAGCPVREVVYRGQTYYVGPSIRRIESGPAVENRLTDPSSPGLDRGPLVGRPLSR